MYRVVKGSTIIEAIIAMTITITVFVATIIIFSNSGASYNQPLKARAITVVGNEVENIRKTGEINLQSVEIDNILIEKSIENYNSTSEIKKVTITAKRIDNNIMLVRRRLLFLNKEIISINREQ